MKEYQIEIRDKDEEIKPLHLPYDKTTMTKIIICPWNENNIECEGLAECLRLMNDGILYVCKHYKKPTLNIEL